VQSTSKLSSSHTHKQSFNNGGDLIEKKRRSEMVQPGNTGIVTDVGKAFSSNSINSQDLVIENP
jgi:hypothetical protein